MLSTPTAIASPNRLPRYILLLTLAIVSGVHGFAQQRLTSQPIAPQLQWNIQSGINEYRLQIAFDAKFEDVLCLVTGTLDRQSDELGPGIGSVAFLVLVTTKTRDERLLIVARDPMGRGLKTMELPANTGTQIQRQENRGRCGF